MPERQICILHLHPTWSYPCLACRSLIFDLFPNDDQQQKISTSEAADVSALNDHLCMQKVESCHVAVAT